MQNKVFKKKYIFLGDCNSINIEIICKSFNRLKKHTKYIIICDSHELKTYISKIKSKLKINYINDPLNFNEYNKSCLNVFEIKNQKVKKYINLINQLKIANNISNSTKRDLITMPIDKSIFKEHIDFTGLSEYLGKLNNTKTFMLMYGEKFSVIPYTTHVNPKNIYKKISRSSLTLFLKSLIELNIYKVYGISFNKVFFLCYNPHCGEKGTLGNEDIKISKVINKFKYVNDLIPADSLYNFLNKKTLFISSYHDQGLIPFKILNENKGINMTLGLKYRRLSPAHGTAKDIKFKNKANINSYIKCMKI